MQQALSVFRLTMPRMHAWCVRRNVLRRRSGFGYHIFFACLFFACTENALAQLRPLEDQYLLNALALNPAYAGSEELMSLTVLKRNQWVGFDGAPSTLTFAIHAPLKNDKVALGLLVVNDKLGFYNETSILGNYAFRLKLGKGKLSFGVAGGIYMNYDDNSRIESVDADDEILMAGRKTFVLPDFSTGVYYYTNTFFAGVSMPGFIRHTFDEASNKYTLSAELNNSNYLMTIGNTFKMSDNFGILPSVLWKFNPVSSNQLDLNLNLIIKDRLWLGTSYRTKNSILWLAQFNINHQLKIAYAYGTTFSELESYQKGTHEIMLKYNFDYLMDVMNPRNF